MRLLGNLLLCLSGFASVACSSSESLELLSGADSQSLLTGNSVQSAAKRAARARSREIEGLRTDIDQYKAAHEQLQRQVRQGPIPQTYVEKVTEAAARLSQLEPGPSLPPVSVTDPRPRPIPAVRPAPTNSAVQAYLREVPKFDPNRSEDLQALSALKRKMLDQ